MEVLLGDRLCKERQVLKNNVCDLTLQRHMYLHEVKKASISLTDIGDAFSVFNFPSSLVDYVKLLAKEVVKKHKALAFTRASLSSTKAFYSIT